MKLTIVLDHNTPRRAHGGAGENGPEGVGGLGETITTSIDIGINTFTTFVVYVGADGTQSSSRLHQPAEAVSPRWRLGTCRRPT